MTTDMATTKTLILFEHDVGYGDALLSHINFAIRGKDMIARQVVNAADQRGADRLAYAVALLVKSGKLDARSAAADALLDYLGVGGLDGPKDVPTWMAEREATESKGLDE